MLPENFTTNLHANSCVIRHKQIAHFLFILKSKLLPVTLTLLVAIRHRVCNSNSEANVKVKVKLKVKVKVKVKCPLPRHEGI